RGVRAPVAARVGAARDRGHRRRLRPGQPRRVALEWRHHGHDRRERGNGAPARRRGGHLLRHLERLQRGRRDQAGAAPTRASVGRDDGERYRPALLLHQAVRRGEAHRRAGPRAPAGRAHGRGAGPLSAPLGSAGMMVGGAVEKVVTAWMSIGLPWGVSKIMREHVESGRVPLEEWSHLALGLRFHAAAMGVPFLPTLTMLGSDLMGVGGTQTLRCPYTGETLALVPALFPDVALLHVHRADRFGNCQIDGYPHMDADIARAASTVLVPAEETIPAAEVRRHPDRTVIPGFMVDAVVPA